MGSINRSHNEADGGIILFSGEIILLYCESVDCHIKGQESFKGRVCLTTHRLVVIVSPYRQNAPVKSLCAPFFAFTRAQVEQPIFGANYIDAAVRDESDPNKSIAFKLKFSKGGAIELAMAVNKAVSFVGRNFNAAQQPPPAYTSPSAQYYQAPPTSYAPGYNCGVQMPVQQFPDQPPIGFIYASTSPPPYPGLNNPGAQPPPAGQPPQQQQQQQQPGGYPVQNLGAYGYPGHQPPLQQQQQPISYPNVYPDPAAVAPASTAGGFTYPGGPTSSYNSQPPPPQQQADSAWPSTPAVNPNWQEDKKSS